MIKNTKPITKTVITLATTGALLAVTMGTAYALDSSSGDPVAPEVSPISAEGTASADLGLPTVSSDPVDLLVESTPSTSPEPTTEPTVEAVETDDDSVSGVEEVEGVEDEGTETEGDKVEHAAVHEAGSDNHNSDNNGNHEAKHGDVNGSVNEGVETEANETERIETHEAESAETKTHEAEKADKHDNKSEGNHEDKDDK